MSTGPAALPAAAPRERLRDSGRSKEQLLAAARALFAERGYDQTTLREVGERAGLDPALIARYFGSKEDLFRAAVRSDLLLDAGAGDVTGLAAHLLELWDASGVGPSVQAMMQPALTVDARESAVQSLSERIIAPLSQRFAAAGASSPDLRAEVVMAALVGIGMTRQLGALPTLKSADRAELIDVISAALQTLAGGPDAP